MFTTPTPQSDTLTAINGTLAFADAELTDDERTAASYTQLFLQEAALARCKAQGIDIGDPNLYQSDSWFNALTWAVANAAGSWVEIVGNRTVNVSKSTHSGSINLSAIMGAVMAFYLGPEAEAEWEAVASLLGSSSDPAVTDFMDFWWSHVSKSSTDTGLSIGPVTKSQDGSLQWAICYYTMTEQIDDWRVMFVSSTFESITVAAGGLTLKLDMGVYNNGVKDALQKRLNADIAADISNVPLADSSAPVPAATPIDLVAQIPLHSQNQLAAATW
jgi:hypothetical protein